MYSGNRTCVFINVKLQMQFSSIGFLMSRKGQLCFVLWLNGEPFFVQLHFSKVFQTLAFSLKTTLNFSLFGVRTIFYPVFSIKLQGSGTLLFKNAYSLTILDFLLELPSGGVLAKYVKSHVNWVASLKKVLKNCWESNCYSNSLLYCFVCLCNYYLANVNEKSILRLFFELLDTSK